MVVWGQKGIIWASHLLSDHGNHVIRRSHCLIKTEDAEVRTPSYLTAFLSLFPKTKGGLT